MPRKRKKKQLPPTNLIQPFTIQKRIPFEEVKDENATFKSEWGHGQTSGLVYKIKRKVKEADE